ncbi:MAG: amino acid adenylation domain-containing protein [Clostridiales bacterium]|nr:amino acid adenylation domain-containing protein [Clostridiales bacterium]
MRGQMDMEKIIEGLKKRGITLYTEKGKLKYKAPKGQLSAEDMAQLREKKEELLNYLLQSEKKIQVAEAPEDRYRPFALTDVQAAYALGRKHTFEYGGVACHVYLELQYDKLDERKVQEVWEILIRRHDMLRAVIHENGSQQVLQQAEGFCVKAYDFQRQKEPQELLNEVKEKMGHAMYELGTWPMFEIAVSHTGTKDVLHFSMEFLIADWKSIWMLLSEFETLYFLPENALPETTLTFRDYLIAENRLRETQQYIKDKEYWLKRVEQLPQYPDLPMRKSTDENNNKFTRYFLEIEKGKWQKLKGYAQSLGITPTSAVLTAYAEVLERWSQSNRFCINLTVLNRMPLHEDVDKIVGDFTSVSLLEVNMKEKNSFINKAKRISAQLYDDLDHRLYSGVEVIRELSRRKGRENAFMPIVFTSAIGLSNIDLIGEFHGSGISQTPQVFIDCQVMDGEYGLQADWDVREGIFPEGMIQDMFQTFKDRLNQLAEGIESWQSSEVLSIPEWQNKIIEEINDTETILDTGMMYTKFLQRAEKYPEKIAVVDEEGSLTYGSLHQQARKVAQLLLDKNVQPNETIAIVMKKNRYQVIAALGILYAGCTYVPIDVKQPKYRRHGIINNTDIKVVISLAAENLELEKDIQLIEIDQLENCREIAQIRKVKETDAAYIIHTSGTTGQPKGVIISHKAAVNTIEDINKKFSVSASDSILGLSQLNFDLSVYDIFGMLSCGASVIYPGESRYMDPSHWTELIKKYHITVWNTVPAFMQILLGYLKGREEKLSLKTILLSGDWIPVSMPSQIAEHCTDAQVVSLGGATEASIWSIYHICQEEEQKNSIPYGMPLANQGFSVLDRKMRDCPMWVTGELFIWGDGLAEGYYNDNQMTDEKFMSNLVTGKRMYKTGDIGCYLKNGEIEFRGRNDNQIKLRGHRIELGEIQHLLEQYPLIIQAVAVLNEEKTEINAVVKVHNEQMLSEESMKEYLTEYLPEYMIPSHILCAGDLPLTSNGKVDRRQINQLFEKSDKNNSQQEDNSTVQDEMQSKLLEIWREVMPDSSLDLSQSFYDVGADSLILAQVATKVREKIAAEIAFDALLRQLIYKPTIADLTQFIREQHTPVAFEPEGKEVKKQSDAEIAFVKEYGGNIKDGLQVIFHGALGALNRFDHLAERLITQNKGQVIGIGVRDVEQYCQLEPSEIVARLSKEYTDIILRYDSNKVQLIGYCFGGVLALEVANRLSEQGNIEIKNLSILDSLLLPPEFLVEDELLMEMMFLDTMPVHFEDIGLQDPSVYEKVLVKEAMKKTTVPAGFLENVSGDEKLNQLGEFFRKLAAVPKEERFKWYSELCERNTGTKMPVELINSFYRVCVNTFKAMHYNVYPYVGSIYYFFAVDTESGFKRLVLDNWRNLAVGGFQLIEIPGDHYSCVEKKEYAQQLADEIDSLGSIDM